MKIRQLMVILSLLLGFQPLVGSDANRKWQTAQVLQIERILDTSPRVDHWEYLLTSKGLAYTLRNGPRDAPYLNSSLGSEVKISSAANGSEHPYDSGEVYVLDVKGQEHKLDLVRVASTEPVCKP